MNFQEPSRSSQGTLDSWKEIAAYLQRDTKTARRWERKKASRSTGIAIRVEAVFMLIRRDRGLEGFAEGGGGSRAGAPRPLWRVPAFVLTMVVCLVMVGNGIRPQVASAQQHRPVVKRALVLGPCGDREASFSRDGR